MMGSLLLDSPELRARYDRVSTRQFEHGKQLIQELGIGHGQRVLDVGCGTGLLGVYVAGLVGTHGLVVGVDPVPLRVTLARLRAQAHFQVHLGRAEELDALESDSFDAAFLNSVIHCLDDRETVLTGIYRVLRAGGKVGFTAIDRDRPGSFHLAHQQAILAAGLRKRAKSLLAARPLLSAAEAQDLLTSTGFRAVSVHTRTQVDHFYDTDDLLDFHLESSFDAQLPDFDLNDERRLRQALKRELERNRGPKGVEQERHIIFAIGEKPYTS
jgi:ubiquinone/menaquinone biosynthesis C-methylase UbiE